MNGLARQAGWVTTKEIESTARSDRALLAMGGADAAFAREFIEVFSKYAVIAGVTSQADSPLPGPADAVAIGIMVIGLIDAGLYAGAILNSLGDAVSPAPSTTTAAPPAVTTAPVASAASTSQPKPAEPDCKQVKNMCIIACTGSLPTPDYGFKFWNCVNRCMAEGGC